MCNHSLLGFINGLAVWGAGKIWYLFPENLRERLAKTSHFKKHEFSLTYLSTKTCCEDWIPHPELLVELGVRRVLPQERHTIMSLPLCIIQMHAHQVSFTMPDVPSSTKVMAVLHLQHVQCTFEVEPLTSLQMLLWRRLFKMLSRCITCLPNSYLVSHPSQECYALNSCANFCTALILQLAHFIIAPSELINMYTFMQGPKWHSTMNLGFSIAEASCTLAVRRGTSCRGQAR